jgi:DNA-binding response OmpR family regulator
LAAQVLVVTPDTTLRGVVQRSVSLLGHHPVVAASVAEARRAVTRVSVDALCLDSILGGEESEQLYAAYRALANGNEPRLLYIGPPAARLVRSTLPQLLRDSIDAFVTKPIESDALTGALRRVLDITGSKRRDGRVLRIRGVALDSLTRNLCFEGGTSIGLTPVEHKLLQALMERAGEFVSQAELLELVWGYPPDGGSELVRAHVSNLRRKLRTIGRADFLRTMPYHGYGFLPEGAE